MLKTYNEAVDLINQGKLLHISGNGDLLKKLPKGNWIGGTTEYFMTDTCGIVTNDKVYVDEFSYNEYRVSVYDEKTISSITKDAYSNGFSIIILPFDSEVHKEYAKCASSYEDIFLKNILGWVSGVNLNVEGQTPLAINGQTSEAHSNKAVVMHVSLPEENLVNLGIINIFSENQDSPVIEFMENSFSAGKCLINGQEMIFADYIAQNNIDVKIPLIGDYSGAAINTSFKTIENGVVHFYAPVFKDIKYRFANNLASYEDEFKTRLSEFKNIQAVFSCNCILNFLYGDLEGKKMDSFFGPITFGEIAYQLVNQTLVYLVIE